MINYKQKIFIFLIIFLFLLIPFVLAETEDDNMDMSDITMEDIEKTPPTHIPDHDSKLHKHTEHKHNSKIGLSSL